MNSLAGIDMGRILLNLSNELFKQLDDLEVQRNLPRAELLREAVDQYLVNQSQTARASAFGIWQGSEERMMVSNTSVSCARNGNGKKIWLFDIDIVIDLFSVKIEAKQALAA